MLDDSWFEVVAHSNVQKFNVCLLHIVRDMRAEPRKMRFVRQTTDESLE